MFAIRFVGCQQIVAIGIQLDEGFWAHPTEACAGLKDAESTVYGKKSVDMPFCQGDF